MMEYLALCVCVCALVAFGGVLSYGDQDGGVKVAMGIILLCTVSIPPIKATLALCDMDVGGFFEDMDNTVTDSALGEVAAQSFEDGTEKLIRERFSLDEDEVRVHVFGLDTSSMKAEKIVVVLRGGGALSDLRGIKSLVEDAGLGRCEVKIEAS